LDIEYDLNIFVSCNSSLKFIYMFEIGYGLADNYLQMYF